MPRLCQIFFLFCSLFLISVGLSSCKDTQTSPSTEIVFPSNNINFTKHVEPLFQQKCSHAPCHGGSTPAAGLNLEYPSYIALIKHIPTLIVQKDTNCLLMQRLDGRLTKMPPPNFPQLTENQMNGVKKWIEEGASNN
jgi:uncharacterized membrane protein